MLAGIESGEPQIWLQARKAPNSHRQFRPNLTYVSKSAAHPGLSSRYFDLLKKEQSEPKEIQTLSAVQGL